MTDRRKGKHQFIDRETRDLLAGNTHALDEIRPRIYDGATTPEVCKLLGIARHTAAYQLRAHADELLSDGYDPETKRWTRRGVIRLSMLARGHRTAEIAAAAGLVTRASVADAGHVTRCDTIIDTALRAAQHAKDSDPDELWSDLSALSRYDLQAVTVALAALLPIEGTTSEILEQLRKFAPHKSKRHDGSMAANGLAQIVPPKAAALVSVA